MRKGLICFVVVLIVFLVSFNTVFAAEYTVKWGDTLSELGMKLNHAIEELVMMNDIQDSDIIRVGQQLVYVSEQDKEWATNWCYKRTKDLRPSDENHQYFAHAIKEIKYDRIRYSIYEPSGLHFEVLLYFADAWAISEGS